MKKLAPGDAATASADIVSTNLELLRRAFPEAFTEGGVNFEVLRQLLGDAVDSGDEKYGLSWFGKRQARQLALTPSTGTLRPAPEDSVDWDTTQNLMIEGDNLEVLKLLQKSYAGKVKLIYIDPPYNTGNDFVYKDDFRDNIANYHGYTGQVEDGRKLTSNVESSGRFHTDWLNMMYPRLRLARDLLRDDGVIFISIDETELPNLRACCSEVFGEECFVAVLTVLCNPKGRSQDKFFATNHEYVAVYSKYPLEKGAFAVAKDDEQVAREYGEEDEYGKFRLLELRNTHREFGKHNRRNLFYPLFVIDSGEVFLESGIGRLEVLPTWDDGFEGCWTWDRAKAEQDRELLVGRKVGRRWKVFRKSYASGADRMLKTILVDKSYSTEWGQRELNTLFETKAKVFQSPKSPNLLADLIQTRSQGGDLVLDFFAGSGTTGHAVMAQNAADGGSRRFVLVQLPEPLDPGIDDQRAAAEFCDGLGVPRSLAEVTKERLRRAAVKVRGENPLFAGDLGFRVFKLDSTNIREWDPQPADLEASLQLSVDHLKDDRTEHDILYELLLKLGLDLCVPIETREIAGKTVHSVGGGVLMVCLAESVAAGEVEGLGLGIVAWRAELRPAGDATCVFRDAAFADDVAKTNLTAILTQHGITNVRSL